MIVGGVSGTAARMIDADSLSTEPISLKALIRN